MNADSGGERTPGSEGGGAHGYFLALEETFIRLRGAPLLLSPADWQTARAWLEEGVPLALAVRVMEQVAERWKGAGVGTSGADAGEPDRERVRRGALAGIRSLRYFDGAVRGAWRRVREMGGGGERSDAPVSWDVDARLRRLAEAVPVDLRDAGRLRAAVVELLGSEAEVAEAALARLDRDFLDAAVGDLSAERLETVTRSVAAARERLRERIGAEELEAVETMLRRSAVRAELGLPTLSLFAPEAAPDTAGQS